MTVPRKSDEGEVTNPTMLTNYGYLQLSDFVGHLVLVLTYSS